MKGILRQRHTAHLFHPLFTRLLFFKLLIFSGHIPTVKASGQFFAECGNGFPGDDFTADRRLNRNGELRAGNDLFERSSQTTTQRFGLGVVKK